MTQTKRFLLGSFLLLSTVATFAQTPSFVRSDIETRQPLSGNIVVGDFNGDRKPDIAVTSHSRTVPQAIYLLLGNGDGTFSAPTLISSSCCSGLAAADFNGDGKLDLLFSGLGGTSVLLGNGDGTFQQEKQSTAVASPRPPLVRDLNRDGILDLAFADQGGGITVLLGIGDGTFALVGTFPISSVDIAVDLACGDFNGDGIPDLAATNLGPSGSIFGTTVSVLLGNGDGTFGPPTEFAVGSYPFPVVAGDFNSDGKMDLAVGNYRSTFVSVLLGQGDGTFLPQADFSAGAFQVGLAVADFNGDGKLDLAAGAPPSLSILPGNGDGTFAANQDFPTLSSMQNFAVGDFNQDGKPDVVMVYFAGDSKLSIFLNTTGVDTTPPAITVSANPSKLRPADGRWVPVTLSGNIRDTGVGLDPGASAFAVSDEYGQTRTHGRITLQTDGSFTFQVLLRASVRSSDKNGREYLITVKAKDKSGNIGSAKTIVRGPLG